MGLMRASFVLSVALCVVTVPSCTSFITPVPQSFSKGPTWTLTPAIVKPLPREPSTSLTSSLQSVLHADSSYCLAAVMLLSTFGLSLERRTVLGKALSAPLATMALALSVANLGLIPFTSPVYGSINQCIVPLAVPLLLFDSDLRRVVRDTGSLLLAFGVGTLATLLGTIFTFMIVPLKSLGADQGWKVACALAARHIGGAINFVAVAETLSVSGTVVSAAIAADNVVVALYFAFLFALAKEETAEDTEAATQSVDLTENELEFQIQDKQASKSTASSDDINLINMAMATTVATTLVTLGSFLTKAILPVGTSALPLTSALTVVSATLFAPFFGRLRAAATALGILGIQMFFATAGAAGSLQLVWSQAPALFSFSALSLVIHFGVLMGVGRGILRLSPQQLYLASNANVGGPTTAAAMAQAKNWQRLVVPALLTGIFGYATATALALALGPLLKQLPMLFIR